ncbi:MAG: type II secretion system protein [Candidatus Paceibacterota bacterium]
MKMTQKGFTLIELLVVIAIIGILSAVVLASLNTARDSANDASAQSSLSSMRAEAEIYYGGNGNSYASLCTDGTTAGGVEPEDLYAAAIAAASGDDANCFDSAGAWAAEIELNDGWFCVDSTGYAGDETASTITSSDFECGA